MTTAVNEQLTGTYKLDPVHSSASFAVKHMVVATFRGRFEEFDAVLEDGRLTGTVNVGSIVVKDPNLAAHLQSPEFFDAERHPELRFESSEIRPDGDQVVVDGELTIKSITRPVQARGTLTGPVETLGGVHKVGLELEAIIDRTEFGLNWNAPLPKGGFALANDVRLIVELELAEDA
ncbi:MAG TPA: YceI family protein [Solirubrobacteraceae bacterium]|nr:YceI family protein [Solirubrobacteraceae bacterium]